MKTPNTRSQKDLEEFFRRVERSKRKLRKYLKELPFEKKCEMVSETMKFIESARKELKKKGLIK